MAETDENTQKLAQRLASAAGLGALPGHVVRRFAALVDVATVMYVDSSIAVDKSGAVHTLTGSLVLITTNHVLVADLNGTRAQPAESHASVGMTVWHRRLLTALNVPDSLNSDGDWADNDWGPVPRSAHYELVYENPGRTLVLPLHPRRSEELLAALPSLMNDLAP